MEVPNTIIEKQYVKISVYSIVDSCILIHVVLHECIMICTVSWGSWQYSDLMHFNQVSGVPGFKQFVFPVVTTCTDKFNKLSWKKWLVLEKKNLMCISSSFTKVHYLRRSAILSNWAKRMMTFAVSRSNKTSYVYSICSYDMKVKIQNMQDLVPFWIS